MTARVQTPWTFAHGTHSEQHIYPHPHGPSTCIDCTCPAIHHRYDRTPDGAYVWQGFNHRWSDNQRVNRLGSWIEKPDCTVWAQGPNPGDNTVSCDTNIVHSGASGMGPDHLDYDDYSNWLTTDSPRFKYRKAELVIRGSESNLHSADAVFHIHSSDPNNVAFLRGFDVVSIGEESKSLKKLTVKIDSESWDSVTETCTYRLYGALNMNCDTMECKASDPNVAYRVTVYSLVVSGEDDELLATRGNLRDEDYCTVGATGSSACWARTSIAP